MITPFQYGKKEVIELVGLAIQVTEIKLPQHYKQSRTNERKVHYGYHYH